MAVVAPPPRLCLSLESAIADALEALEEGLDSDCIVCGSPTRAMHHGAAVAQVCTVCGAILEDAA